MDAHAQPSPALVEANRRLYELRVQLQAQDPADKPSVGDTALDTTTLPWNATSPATLAEQVASLPDHLGWGGAAATAVIRSTHQPQTKTATIPDLTQPPQPPNNSSKTTLSPQASTGKNSVKLFPDIALGMLHQSQEGPGRIWLLLRYLDTAGSGILRIDILKKQLAKKDSQYHIYGWRQLRNLLKQGQGVFWQRDKNHIWLRSATRMAAALGVERLTGRPVALPLNILLDSIGTVRAHLYASFHSGRTKDNPISREKLKDITSIPERTQLEYEKTAVVIKQHNIAIGERHTQETTEERAWQHGRATFMFLDSNGRQGPAGREYIAWHLPNSYTGPHNTRCKGRQKKINQQLVDLVMKGMRGNDQEQVDKLFLPHGAAAAQAYKRNQTNDTYWPQGPTRTRNSHLWHVLPAKKESLC